MPVKDKTQGLIWRANYTDGTNLVEKDQNGKEHLFKEIDITKLESFDIINPPTKADDFEREEVYYNTTNLRGEHVKLTFTTYNNEVKPVLHLTLSPDQRLIFVRRRMKLMGSMQAIIGKDPNSYPDKTKIPKCKKCNQFTEFKNIPYPIQFPERVVILVGWQQVINGKNIQAINYLFPDGSVELSGQWGTDAIHKEAHPYIPEK